MSFLHFIRRVIFLTNLSILNKVILTSIRDIKSRGHKVNNEHPIRQIKMGIFFGHEKIISYCTYLVELFKNTYKKKLHVNSFFFEVDPSGICNCFKKKLKVCPRYNQLIYTRRKCSDPKYDDNCIEIT